MGRGGGVRGEKGKTGTELPTGVGTVWLCAKCESVYQQRPGGHPRMRVGACVRCKRELLNRFESQRRAEALSQELTRGVASGAVRRLSPRRGASTRNSQEVGASEHHRVDARAHKRRVGREPEPGEDA